MSIGLKTFIGLNICKEGERKNIRQREKLNCGANPTKPQPLDPGRACALQPRPP